MTSTIGVNLGFSGSRRLGRAERKREIWVCKIHVKSDPLAYPLKNAAKPNFIPPELRTLDTESVGFLSVFGQCSVYGENFVFL